MKFYHYTLRDCGDGSSTIEFFETENLIELVEQLDPDSYAMGEGGGDFMVDGHIHNIEITTLADIKESYGADKVEQQLAASSPTETVTPEPTPVPEPEIVIEEVTEETPEPKRRTRKAK